MKTSNGTPECHIFIYLGFLRHFQHCTGHITMGSWKGRGNQYIKFVRVLYCKLPTNGKQLPALPLEAVPGIEPRPQRWEARVLPLCHRGPQNAIQYFFYCVHIYLYDIETVYTKLTPIHAVVTNNMQMGINKFFI